MRQYTTDDKTGKTYNKLTVLHRLENSDRIKWVCKCECGNTTVVTTYSLTSGGTKSCGCMKKEYIINRKKQIWIKND